MYNINPYHNTEDFFAKAHKKQRRRTGRSDFELPADNLNFVTLNNTIT